MGTGNIADDAADTSNIPVSKKTKASTKIADDAVDAGKVADDAAGVKGKGVDDAADTSKSSGSEARRTGDATDTGNIADDAADTSNIPVSKKTKASTKIADDAVD